ncbi:alternative ribosome rescue aminoacyl-tRNA hydrolase ArfB [Nocardioides yefusunii]|uniref:Alternative ribosome rescue aminoacyl-tRNA hydrolase ArfB n=1 Tax=Nocardioides yefusunii TaxID=2500546 RepID=A0ABW1QV44_9ACTN|nr:alternative ribosome rescue aminoacyl-tRNA hydrolase ArfB [Nocardioides yefusunii]
MIRVQGREIPESELIWRFSRASGPGGQHVNTTDSRVQLTWSPAESKAIPEPLREQLMAKLGTSVTVVASEHRSQWRNRQAAEERMTAMLTQALVRVASRRPTKPTRGSQRRRLDAKKQRGETKRLRGRVQD